MVPEGWVATSLGECVSFRSGGTPSKRNPDYWDGDIPWISAKDLKSHRITDAQDHLTDAGAASAKMAEPDNILLLVRGMTLLKDVPVGLVTRSMAFNQDIKALVSSLNVDPLFLSYLLVGKRLAMMGLVNTANHGTGRLDTDLLKSLPLVLPPLPEQRKIADILTTWDQTIETTEALLAAARAQKRALMQSLLTGKRRFPEFEGQDWKEERLVDLMEGRKTKGRIVPTNEEGVGVPYIGAASFEGEFSAYTDAADALICQPTDLLVLWDGENAGAAAVGLHGAVSSTVVRFRFDARKVLASLVCSVMNLRNYQIRAVREGSGIPHMTKDFDHWFEISLPPLAEQEMIMSAIDAAQVEVSTLANQIEKLRTEKKALMQQLLTGKRRVKIDSDVDRIIDEATTHG